MLLKCGVGEASWEPLGLQGDPTSPFWRRSALGFLWKEWCWNWNSNTLATWWEELTHLKRSWCWEGLGSGREGDDRGWDGWMASPTRWTWVWVNSGSWWWTGRGLVCCDSWSHRVGHDWVTELNWIELNVHTILSAQSFSCVPLWNPLGLYPARLLCPWDFSGKNTGEGSQCPPPGDLPYLEIKPAPPVSPALQVNSYPLSHQGRPF